MKILAAIVTYNRCALLSRCIDHLQAQSLQADQILVINNACTDGTVEMLIQRGVSFLTQENVGSAGGWHSAIQYAIEHNFDAIWLMDDDGFPDACALSKLAPVLVHGVVCASSVVLREDNPSHFVFSFPLLNAKGLPIVFGFPRKLNTMVELREVAINGFYPFAHFFNGALISVAAARQVGNVNRNFFIFGDEVDYFFRLRKAGQVVSVLDAFHFHPDVTQRPYTPVKVYYYIKNTLILNSRYFDMNVLRGVLTVAAVLLRTLRRNGLLAVLSYLLGNKSSIFYMAIIRGLRGMIGKDFNG